MSIEFTSENIRQRVAVHTAVETPFSGVVCRPGENGERTMYVSWEERFTIVRDGQDGRTDRGSREITVFLTRDHVEAMRDRLTEMLAEFDTPPKEGGDS